MKNHCFFYLWHSKRCSSKVGKMLLLRVLIWTKKKATVICVSHRTSMTSGNTKMNNSWRDLALFICLTDNIFIFRAPYVLHRCHLQFLAFKLIHKTPYGVSSWDSSNHRRCNKYIHMFDTDSAWHNSTCYSLEAFSHGVVTLLVPPRLGFQAYRPSRRDYVNISLLMLWFDRGWASLTRYEGNTF